MTPKELNECFDAACGLKPGAADAHCGVVSQNGAFALSAGLPAPTAEEDAREAARAQERFQRNYDDRLRRLCFPKSYAQERRAGLGLATNPLKAPVVQPLTKEQQEALFVVRMRLIEGIRKAEISDPLGRDEATWLRDTRDALEEWAAKRGLANGQIDLAKETADIVQTALQTGTIFDLKQQLREKEAADAAAKAKQQAVPLGKSSALGASHGSAWSDLDRAFDEGVRSASGASGIAFRLR